METNLMHYLSSVYFVIQPPHVSGMFAVQHQEVYCVYTGCPRRNVPDFGRVFLMLKYTDITQNTYVKS